MSKPASDDLDRTSGRFVRNLALSLSGGALLALVGAAAAHAQDASTDSSGLGATGTGDATSVGNHSGSNTTQGGTISGAQGSVQIITQTGGINNNGVAVANTGGNRATGNDSHNTANASQTAHGGAGGAVNNGQAANGSDGAAFITTGNASAVGNQSTTNLNQTISARGALGGILVLTQNSTVTNSGRAFAGTGANTAEGNGSRNDSALTSTLDILHGLGANSGKATNTSNGRATIATGNASAMGNVSDTSVTQSSNGAAGGDGMGGGLVLIPQTTEVTNDGRAEATTGDNEAEGNVSHSGTDVEQHIGSTSAPSFSDTGIAANNGEASNWSAGTASIRTGDASAVGNQSSSNALQTASSDLTKTGGLSVLVQDPTIVNFGRAEANTGDNEATGNDSKNPSGGLGGADVEQFIPIQATAGLVDSGVVSNSAEASNQTDGTATIATGAAWANGNRSRAATSQSSTADHGNLDLFPQSENVANIGIAAANTGDNGATGNDSSSDSYVVQGTGLPPTGVDDAILSGSGRAANSSDGAASITTGAASAAGNESSTTVSQAIDPLGLVLPVQTAVVVNAGVGVADTGHNHAEGNGSSNEAHEEGVLHLFDNDGAAPDIDAGLVIGANQGEASNSSDGAASVTTGAATALGNHSDTWIGQSSTGSVDGLGLVVNTQTAAVANLGAGIATTGGNIAQGNIAQNGDGANKLTQEVRVGANDVVGATITTGILTASNAGSASNTSDGTASVETGAADATGNRARTRVGQTEGASVGGIGGVLNTQAAVVANVGLGVANTGGNSAIGNTSSSVDSAVQTTELGSNDPGSVTITAPTITLANSASLTNSSGGTADVRTGSASATGNASSTDIAQDPGSSVDGLGLVVDTQVAAVANVGIGVANSGGNLAVGNASNNTGDDGSSGAQINQTASIGSENDAGVATIDIAAAGPLVGANQADVSNASDGTGRVRTGNAQAQGNVSTTTVDQAEAGTIDGLGLAIDTQVAGVANVGVAVANSGLNAAVGNVSDNGSVTLGQLGPVPAASLAQIAQIGSLDSTGTVDLTAAGPLAASNSGTASNASNGTGQVGTGNATASGNTSATTIDQRQTADVRDMGLIVNTQAAGVANVGIGVANSGLNAAVGNASGFLDPTGGGPGSGTPNQALAVQESDFVSNTGTAAPTSPVTVLGPLTATNQGEASNSSDGNACVCTGNATASGNISTTTLNQDLDTSVGTGVAVLTEAGGVLNAGVGIANSGLNLALGNISQNLAAATQLNTDNVGLASAPGGVVGPQTVNAGGGATNDSNGTGKVGTGNATATGNESTTGLVQAAKVDSDLAVSTLAGGTTNTGLGLANSGVNLGVGNASVNDARLDQTADGAGIVSSVGTASNESDGSGLVGNPSCNVPGTPTATPGKPGAATLPRTGAPIEVEAAVGLMLLLAGFGLRRKSRQLA